MKEEGFNNCSSTNSQNIGCQQKIHFHIYTFLHFNIFIFAARKGQQKLHFHTITFLLSSDSSSHKINLMNYL